MISKYNLKQYLGILGLIFIICFVLLAFIVAFTFDPPNENNINEAKYVFIPMLGNILFYIGAGLLIITGLLHFKDKVL